MWDVEELAFLIRNKNTVINANKIYNINKNVIVILKFRTYLLNSVFFRIKKSFEYFNVLEEKYKVILLIN